MVEDMSEAPVLTPLTPLGDFITTLGKAPDKDALTTYLARLRENVRPCYYFCRIIRSKMLLLHTHQYLASCASQGLARYGQTLQSAAFMRQMQIPGKYHRQMKFIAGPRRDLMSAPSCRSR
jgi:hypothetical protein